MGVTIKEIARYSGVSIPTVSKVINKKENVREALRIRVEAVIDKYNYRPSSIARGMKIQKTHTIGLVIPKIINTFYVEIIERIEREVKKKDYALILGNSDEDLDREINCLRTFSNMRVDGLILASTGRNQEYKIQKELASFQALNIPVVIISRSLPNTDFDTVELDNRESAYQVVKYLIENGHRRIAIISSPAQTSAGQERIDGYLHAHDEVKLPVERNLIHMGEATVESGYRLTRKWLNRKHKPTGIFIGSNFQLLGVLRATKELNIKIPEDLSVVGFHDSDWISFASPPLTVVTPDMQRYSNLAVDLLFDRIDGTYSGRPRHYRLPTKMVLRGSVRRM